MSTTTIIVEVLIIGFFAAIWLEPLARYGCDKPVTHAVLRAISDQTRSWYFQKGGIYLTKRSRKPYFKWKEVMQPLLDDPNLAAEPDREIDKVRLDATVAAGSALRTALSDDIGTKRLSRV